MKNTFLISLLFFTASFITAQVGIGTNTPDASAMLEISSHTHSLDVPETTSTDGGNHHHTVTVASGGTAAPLNVTPQSLSVNMFVFLGQK